MLESLRKKMSFNKQEGITSEGNMLNFEASQALAAQLQDALDTIQQLNSVVEEKQSVLATLTSEVESLKASYKEAQDQLASVNADKVLAAEKSRKEALAAVMGSENPELETEFAILKSLDDAAFQIVIKSKAAAVEAVNKSEMFKEIGVAGEAEIKDQPQESAEMRVLKQKHQPK